MADEPKVLTGGATPIEGLVTRDASSGETRGVTPIDGVVKPPDPQPASPAAPPASDPPTSE